VNYYSLFSIAHGYSYLAQLTAVSPYTLQYALKRKTRDLTKIIAAINAVKN